MVHLLIDDEGNVWYCPDGDKDPQLLADSNSLCGVSVFSTGVEDPLRDCCSWHDNAYQKRAFFEERGWNRKKIDDYFRKLMYRQAGSDISLFYRANIYYHIVRMIGWVFYYKHPGYEADVKDNECKLKLRGIKHGNNETSN